jgi:hypothetical protein
MDEFVNTVDLFLQRTLHLLEDTHGVNNSRVVPTEVAPQHGVGHVNTVTVNNPAEVMSWNNNAMLVSAGLQLFSGQSIPRTYAMEAPI